MKIYREKVIKRGSRRNLPLIGTWQSLAQPPLAALMARHGFDFAIIDTEHGVFNTETLEAVVMAYHGTGTKSIVRVGQSQRLPIQKALDTGTDGILIPMVNSGEEAALAVRLAKFPPEGVRGVGARTPALYGEFAQYHTRANEEISVVVQVETREAVDNLDDILSVEGLDAVFVGPEDLACSLGHMGEPRNSKVRTAIQEIIQAARRARVPVGGVGVADPEWWFDRKIDFLVVGSDLFYLVDGMQRALNAVGEYRARSQAAHKANQRGRKAVD